MRVLDRVELALRPVVETLSERRGVVGGTHLIDRVLELQVAINYIVD